MINKITKLNITIILLLSVVQYGCGGKNSDALAVLAMAGTLTAIQVVRTDYTVPRAKCNEFCGVCDFPCGNRCVPIGTLCYSPPGSACKFSKSPINKKTPGSNENSSGQCQDPLQSPLQSPVNLGIIL